MAKQITNNIKLLRVVHGDMTQEQLANLTQVTRQTITAIENNKYSPSLELAFKIADVFNEPISNVFSYGANDSFEDVYKNKGGGDKEKHNTSK